MRRVLLLCALLGCGLATGPVGAQVPGAGQAGVAPPSQRGVPPRYPVPPRRPESDLATDAFLVGAVRQGSVGGVRFDVLRTHVRDGEKETYDLRIRVLTEGPKAPIQEAVVGSADLPALRSVVAKLVKGPGGSGGQGEPAQGQETDRRFGSLEIGKAPPPASPGYYLVVGEKPAIRVALAPDELREVEVLLGKAADKIRELEMDRRRRARPPA